MKGLSKKNFNFKNEVVPWDGIFSYNLFRILFFLKIQINFSYPQQGTSSSWVWYVLCTGGDRNEDRGPENQDRGLVRKNWEMEFYSRNTYTGIIQEFEKIVSPAALFYFMFQSDSKTFMFLDIIDDQHDDQVLLN